jgi:hypothetical protein
VLSAALTAPTVAISGAVTPLTTLSIRLLALSTELLTASMAIMSHLEVAGLTRVQ